MKIKLLQDIIIPAGTVFDTAPEKTERYGEGHVIHTFELSKDASGHITICIGSEGDAEREQLKDLFEIQPEERLCSR